MVMSEVRTMWDCTAAGAGTCGWNAWLQWSLPRAQAVSLGSPHVMWHLSHLHPAMADRVT